MKNSIKCSIAALCAITAVCAPLGTSPVFSDIIAPITASADASDVLSGTRNYDFYREYQSEGYYR